MKLKPYKNRTWLYRQYVVMEKSVTEIAKMCQVTPVTIDRYVKKFSLQRSRRSWTRE